MLKMTINNIAKTEFKYPKHAQEQEIMRPVMDAKREIENRRIDSQANVDLSVEAELDRLLKELG